MAFRLRKNDMVQVISGEYKGKTGKILKVIPEKNRAIVEGINMIKRHTKPTPKNQQGGIVEKEASIDLSNIMLLCPKQVNYWVGVSVLEWQRVGFPKGKELIE